MSHVTTVDVPGLGEALARAVSGRVVGVERRRSIYSTSVAIDDVRVTTADGITTELVLKHLDDRLAEADGIRPAFLHHPEREIDVYQSVLAGAALGTPTCHAVLRDATANRAWLLLEKVPGVELYQVGDLDVWLRAARWAANLHTHFAGALPARSSLLRYDARYYRTWPARAVAFDDNPTLRWLAARWEELVDALAAQPVTFVHGELYASNVLTAGRRTCAVDWEMAGIGPGLLDLAALTSGWDDDGAAGIAAAYFDACPAHADESAFCQALDDCRLLVAVQWLGWAPNWTAPADHAHDWLATAVRLAEERGW